MWKHWVKQKLWRFTQIIIAKCEVSLNLCPRLHLPSLDSANMKQVPYSVFYFRSVQSTQIKWPNYIIYVEIFDWVSDSSTPTNKNTKLLETVFWFHIYLTCFYGMKTIFIYSPNNNKSIISFCTVREPQNICVQIFWDFARIFDKSKL